MEKKTLHIISLDIPFPPSKGSVISIYHRIKSLHEAGIEIILHAFYKEFSLPNELAMICKRIYLLPRKKMWHAKNLHTPLFVQSRRSNPMVEVLLQDDHPILFEGLHTLYHFNDPRLATRKKFIRLHNIESNYYSHLYRVEQHILKKNYYSFESNKLLAFEKKMLPLADAIFTISEKENQMISPHTTKSIFIPPFIDPVIKSKPGMGEYALYHGDLSIKENEKATRFLIQAVLPNIDFPLKIAGRNPSHILKRLILKNKNCTLVENPSNDEMFELIENAQVILAPFSQSSGYKIKLLESLRLGRHIITSDIIQDFKELRPFMHFATRSKEWSTILNELKTSEYTQELYKIRKEFLTLFFDNKNNAQKMIGIIFPEI